MKLMTEWAGGAHPQELYFSIAVDSSQQWTRQSSLTPVPSYSPWGGCRGRGETQGLTLFPTFLFSLPVSLSPERSLMDQKLLPYILIYGQVESWDGILVSSLPTTQACGEWLMFILKRVMEQAGCSQTCSWPLGSRYSFQVEISESPLSAAWGWLAGWRVLNLVFKLHNALELQEQRFSNLGMNSEHSSESNQPEFSFSAGLSLKLSLLMIGCLAPVNVMDLISRNWFSHKEYTWEK